MSKANIAALTATLSSLLGASYYLLTKDGQKLDDNELRAKFESYKHQ